MVLHMGRVAGNFARLPPCANDKLEKKAGSQLPRNAEGAAICLECAAIFRHLAVNEPVSALGLYKSNDDHTQSDDLRDCFFRIGGDGGGNLVCVGAGLSDPSGTSLFTRLSVGSDRLSGAAPDGLQYSGRR